MFCSALLLCLTVPAFAHGQSSAPATARPREVLTVSIRSAAGPAGSTVQIVLEESGLQFAHVTSLIAYVRSGANQLADTEIIFRAAPDVPLHELTRVILAFSLPQLRGPQRIQELCTPRPVFAAAMSPLNTGQTEPAAQLAQPAAMSAAAALKAKQVEASPQAAPDKPSLQDQLAAMTAGKARVAFVLDVSSDYIDQVCRLFNRTVTAMPVDREFAVYALDAGRSAVCVAPWAKANAVGRQAAARALQRHSAPLGATNLAALSASVAIDGAADCVVLITEGPRLQAGQSLSLTLRTLAEGRQINALFVGAVAAEVLQAMQLVAGESGLLQSVTPRQLAEFAETL